VVNFDARIAAGFSSKQIRFRRAAEKLEKRMKDRPDRVGRRRRPSPFFGNGEGLAVLSRRIIVKRTGIRRNEIVAAA
jgi:hypothetical protein